VNQDQRSKDGWQQGATCAAARGGGKKRKKKEKEKNRGKLAE